METLKIEIPFVVFLDNTLESWESDIINIRKNVGPVVIIKTALTDIPFWKYKDRVIDIINNSDFINKIRYKNDITYKLPEYSLIQYSKFGWIKQAFNSGYFSGDKYIWMDAGISRFFLPHHGKQIGLINTNSLFEINREHLLNELTADNYIGTNECIIRGGSFIIDKTLIEIFYNNIIYIWENEMLNKKRFDNEQIALAILYKINPTIFTFVRDNGHQPSTYDPICSKLLT